MTPKTPRTLFTALLALLSFSCNGGKGSGLPLVSTASADEAEASSEQLNLAVKYVEYLNPQGQPVMSREALNTLTEKMNALVAGCKIRFVLEEVQEVEPAPLGLTYGLDSLGTLDKIRAQFDNPKQLVIVNTGEWAHESVGSANAWTTMPGQTPSGAVIEAPVSDFAELVAHELGHYLSLDHVSDQSNLMNPVIYDNSRALDSGQCASMRETAKTVRADALR
ncbi:MAG: matrixin family metalloprotease [Oligoflexia bacterium]|nr:matrixin family metalloprotease [Oligoflexia bacterium]